MLASHGWRTTSSRVHGIDVMEIWGRSRPMTQAIASLSRNRKWRRT